MNPFIFFWYSVNLVVTASIVLYSLYEAIRLYKAQVLKLELVLSGVWVSYFFMCLSLAAIVVIYEQQLYDTHFQIPFTLIIFPFLVGLFFKRQHETEIYCVALSIVLNSALVLIFTYPTWLTLPRIFGLM